MDIEAVVEQRLREQLGSTVGAIDTALTLTDALDKPLRFAVQLYVTPLQERPLKSHRTTGLKLQRVSSKFGVVFAIKSLADKNHDRAVNKLAEARQAVRTAVFGWLPAGAVESCEMAGSDIVKMETGQLWWMDQFTTEYFIEQALSA